MKLLQEYDEIVAALRITLNETVRDPYDEEHGTDGFNGPWTAFVIDPGFASGVRVRVWVSDNALAGAIVTANGWTVGPQFTVTNPTASAVTQAIGMMLGVAFVG